VAIRVKLRKTLRRSKILEKDGKALKSLKRNRT
jgi:hypothetical protein